MRSPRPIQLRGQLAIRRVLNGAFLLTFLGACLSSSAATYYVDPAAGSMTNPGTLDQPWSTLEAVTTAGKSFIAGDVLLLRSGHHGSPTIRGHNEGEVLVRVEDGARATLKNLVVRAASNWRVRGLEISPETAPEFERITLVNISADATKIVIEHCEIYTIRDSSPWTAADWDAKACNGISISGPNNRVSANRLLNVNFGISVTGASNVVERSVIENFSGDGMRGLGDYGVFEFNTVKNCYDVNANHDDGFQSWSVGPGGVGTGVVRGIILRGNRILNYEDASQPHRRTLQGIGCFDGFFEDWIIENNEILTDHWHGITLSGARNCRIVNNTVVDLNTASPGPPWIRIGQHKDGTASSGNIIRNNLATDYSVDAGAAVQDHNLEIRDYPLYFRDYEQGDLHLRAGSPAIDAGSAESAPAADAAGVARPLDGDGDGAARWDVGAHEFVHPTTDSDRDGMSDVEEGSAGTSPVDSMDVLRLTLAPDSAGTVRLSWPSVAGRGCALVAREDAAVGAWVLDESDPAWTGTGGVLATTFPVLPGVTYFRVLLAGP
jgi:hypothetical protein